MTDISCNIFAQEQESVPVLILPPYQSRKISQGYRQLHVL